MNEDLKPCPFCGGEATLKYLETRGYYIKCEKCGVMQTNGNQKAEAYEAWNRMGNGDKASPVERTAKVETVEKPNVFKCGECGQYFHSTAWGSPVEYCSRCGAKLDWSGNE